MRTVFIIEDDPVVLHVYKTQLEKAGFQVRTATNGEESFYLLLHNASPDVILLDLMLPKINGVDILKTIRAQRNFETTPIFVLTNNSLGDLAKEALNAGANQVFDKSKVIPADIVDAIRESLSVSLQTLPSLKETEPTRSIIDTAPETIISLCKGLQALTKTENQQNRLTQLTHLHERVQDLAKQAAAAGLRSVSQMGTALESLLRQLSENLNEINASNLRTISHGIDFLGVLFKESSRSAPSLTTPIKVLVVDDDDISRLAIISALERVKLDFVGVGNPQDALKALEENSFDLVFLDISMPEISGFEVCLKLRKLPYHSRTPVIFVTSLSDFASRSRSRLIGGSDLIAKPFLFTELSVKALTYAFKYRLLDPSASVGPSIPADEEDDRKSQSCQSVVEREKMADISCPSLPAELVTGSRIQTEEVIMVRNHDVESIPVVDSEATPKSKEDPAEDPKSDSISGPLKGFRRTVINGVITLDESGTIKGLNSVAAGLFGYELTEITGKNINVLIPHAVQENAGNLKKLFVDAVRAPQGLALIGQRKDGLRLMFNFLLKEITVSGRRLFTGLIREERIRSRTEPGPSGKEEENPKPEEIADNAKNGRPPAVDLPSKIPIGAAVGMAPLAQTQARPGQETAARQKLEARCGELLRIRGSLEKDLAEHQKAGQCLQESVSRLEASLGEKASELSRLESVCRRESIQRETFEGRLTELSSTHTRVTEELNKRQKALQQVQDHLQSTIESQERELRDLHSTLRNETLQRSEAHKQAIEFGKKVSGLEEQLAQWKQLEKDFRHRQNELEAQLEKQVRERRSVEAKLGKELSELERAEETRAKLSVSRDELARELAERTRNEEQLRKTQAVLEGELKERTGALTAAQSRIEKELQQRQQLQERALRLASTETDLARQLEQHKQTEQVLREKSTELESQIEERTSQIDQLQNQLQKEVQHRQQVVDQAGELGKTQAAVERQLAVHKQAEETWRTKHQKLEAEGKKQAGQLTLVQDQLHKEGAERRQAQAQIVELLKAQAAVQQELTKHRQNQEHWKATEQDLKGRLEKQTAETVEIRLQLQKQGEQRQQLQEQAASLASTETVLARRVEQHKQTEQALQEKSAELESQIEERTGQIDQLQNQLQKEVQHRQQAVDQARQLGKIQAAVEQQLAIHKQAEETWRTKHQKLEAEGKKKANQLIQVQDQWHKKSTECQQAQAQAAELVKGQTVLQQELTEGKRAESKLQRLNVEFQQRLKTQAIALANAEAQLEKVSIEHQQVAAQAEELSKAESALKEELSARRLVEDTLSRAKTGLEKRIKEQNGELDDLRVELKRPTTELLQMRQRISELTDSENALKQERNQWLQTDVQFEKARIEMEMRLQVSARESGTARSELQKEINARVKAEAELAQERYASLESTSAKLSLAEDLYSSLREATTRIGGFSGRLLETNLTKDQQSIVEAIRETVESFPTQEHLLEFSRWGVELADAGCSEFGILQMVEVAIEPFETEAKKQNIVISSLVHLGVPGLVTGCEGRLRRVLAHFINSSMQFTQGESVIVSVTKESEAHSQLVLKFSVHGGSHDLAEEFQRQLVKACSQTGELGPRNYAALELGLAAAKKLVEMMGGEFGIDITRNSTSLWCTLTFPKLPAISPSSSGTAELGNLRVLVIEETDIKRNIIQTQITASGTRNRGVNNGVEALSLLRQETLTGDPFKIALISTGLPDLNGLTLIKILKGDPVLAATRLVILYDVAEAFSDEPYRKEQVFDFLSKPIRQSELFKLLARIVLESTSDGAVAGPGLISIQS